MQRILQFYIITLLSICVLCNDPRLLDPFHYSRFLAGSVFLLICVILLVVRKVPLKIRTNWLDVSILLFCLWNFISMLWAYNFAEALYGALKWLLFAGGYMVSRFFIQNSGGQFPTYLSRFSRITTLIVLVMVGYEMLAVSAELGYSNESLYRLKVLFGHKSLVSGFLVLLLPINLMSMQASKMTRLSFSHLLITSQILMIVLLQSRSAYVALFVILVIMAFFIVRYRKDLFTPGILKVVIVTAGLFLVLLSYFVAIKPDLRERLNPLTYAKSQTATERQLVWIKTMEMVRDRPVLGVGVGNWKIELPGRSVEGSYRMQDQNVVFTRVHNDFLEVWSELGFIGFICFISIFGLAIWTLWKDWQGNGGWMRTLLMGGISAYIILSLIDFPKERIEFLLLLGIYLALIRSCSNSAIKLPLSANRWMSPVLFVMVLGMIVNIYVGYERYKGELWTKKLFGARSKKNWQEVIQLAEKATSQYYQLDPSTVPIAFYSGVAHYNLGEIELADVDFEVARRNHPYNFHVINNQATILIQQEKYHEAIPLLEEAIRINDRFEDALFNLSYCYYQLGDYESAHTTVLRIPGDSDKKDAYLKQIAEARNSGN